LEEGRIIRRFSGPFICRGEGSSGRKKPLDEGEEKIEETDRKFIGKTEVDNKTKILRRKKTISPGAVFDRRGMGQKNLNVRVS